MLAGLTTITKGKKLNIGKGDSYWKPSFFGGYVGFREGKYSLLQYSVI